MMEKISAACAMEWSIELEKGLRSKKPGRPIEAIRQIGPRLQRWSKEPSSTMGVLNMFGLVPGEDRLFLNTILLRLADTFKFGDKVTRICVLKVFLLERKRQNKKNGQSKGILAKERVPNYQELLKRVKIVFDTGDTESRALALCLLGCWADIAKDSAEVRYMVLTSLVSCHVMEVKASLFAASCFSEVSEDFASVFLEVLIKVVTSSEISSTLKLAGAQAFAKMGFSYMLASRAYKTGKKLVLDSSDEEFIMQMLLSLSKLASKSALLITFQVDFLLSFINNKYAFRVQSMALRCMHILLSGGVCRFPITRWLTKLFHMLGSNNLPECEVLQILCKVFRSTKPSFSDMEVAEFMKWVSVVESVTQSPITSNRILAFQLLVEMSRNPKMAMERLPSENCFKKVPSQVILLILGQLEQLVNPVIKSFENVSEVTHECESLLNLVLSLVEEYPVLGILALTKIRSCIKSLLDVYKGGMGVIGRGDSVNKFFIPEGEKHCPIATKLVFFMYRSVVSCTEILNEASAITDEAQYNVKLLVETLNKSYLYNQDTCTVDLLLFHSRVMQSGLLTRMEICDTEHGFDVSDNVYWIKHEMYTLEFMKKMMTGRDNWAAYRAGKSAACQGSWFVAAYTFSKLKDMVQSDSCRYWLKSLAMFSRAESSILLLYFPNQDLRLVRSSVMDEIWVEPYCCLEEINQDVACNAKWLTQSKKINEAYSDVRSAAEMLEASARIDQAFIFQRWFLLLRSKVLEVLVDIFKLLNSSHDIENIDNIKQVEGSKGYGLLGDLKGVESLPYFLMQISFRLNRLVQEFDCMATSFMDMDAKSFRSISRLALNCSLLAFCTGYVLYYPNLHSLENSRYWNLKKLRGCSPSLLIQDLIERLFHIDIEMTTNLKNLLTTISEQNICFSMPPRALVHMVGDREQETLDICKFTLSGVLRMLDEARGKGAGDGEPYQDSKTKLQFLSDILKKWINTSFQLPKYFFQVRPSIGAELYVSNADTRNPDRLSVFLGFQLSLHICIQVKSTRPVKITRLHCILASKPSNVTPGLNGESKGQVPSGLQPCRSDDMLDLSEKLWLHLTECAKESGKKHKRVCNGDGSVWSFVTFEPSERGQGFSTCLLDVSAFPVGSYKISWHSCCIDSKGSYWSLLPLSSCPVFNVKNVV